MKIKTLILATAICCASASATEIIYTPINPTFGGNPLNGSFLLSKASAQNDNSESRETNFVDRYKQSLERSIINSITRKFADGEENPAGEYDAGDYKILVIDLGDGGFEVQITNELTGEVTTIIMRQPTP
ncbi:curli production assembly protein CsgF [Shewanella sp. 202IG2-18]|uniref:curli assembly protein CsgF n=1 Tax=Parashewanella hymeniacidonis TaxID=2807618 RepID=UPI00195F30A6|nr:curli assembly protein CsgF [Parashewanella hymeniacidonis]MBM7074396.1 curli production assembly protein CsgF [Parashewanella hymeniacidonis]